MLVLLFVVIKSNPTCKITETNEVRVNVILLKVHKIHLKGASAKILKKYSETEHHGTGPWHKKPGYALCETLTSRIDGFGLIFHSMLILIFQR